MQLSQRQAANAATIVGVGKSAGMSERDQTIALMVALVESSLLMYANSTVPESLSYSHDAVGHDHDSLGLFQQRPSSGWGTVAQLMDASYDAHAFYNALNKLGVRRNLMSPGTAAQTVQVSAFPDAYALRWGDAQSVFKQVSGAAPQGVGMGGSSSSAGGNTSAGNATSSAGSTPVTGNPSLFGGLATITQELTSREFWTRAGMFGAGMILFLIALLVIVNKSGVVGKAAGAAKTAAKVGAAIAV